MKQSATVEKIWDQRVVVRLNRQIRKREPTHRIMSMTGFMAQLNKPVPGKYRPRNR